MKRKNRHRQIVLTDTEKLACALLKWYREDKSALSLMQFCKRENILYKDLLQLNRDITVHIDVYELAVGKPLDECVRYLMCDGGKTVSINFFEMALEWLGVRRFKKIIYVKTNVNQKIIQKTLWRYDDETRECDHCWADIYKAEPFSYKAERRLVIEQISNPSLPPEANSMAIVLSKELSEKINNIFVDLLSNCKQESSYSVSEAAEAMGLNYNDVKLWASIKKDWQDILDECHRYCFTWAEFAGIYRRISTRKALKYMCDSDEEFKQHLEWCKTWEDKVEELWKEQKPKPLMKQMMQQCNKTILLELPITKNQEYVQLMPNELNKQKNEAPRQKKVLRINKKKLLQGKAKTKKLKLELKNPLTIKSFQTIKSMNSRLQLTAQQQEQQAMNMQGYL